MTKIIFHIMSRIYNGPLLPNSFYCQHQTNFDNEEINLRKMIYELVFKR